MKTTLNANKEFLQLIVTLLLLSCFVQLAMLSDSVSARPINGDSNSAVSDSSSSFEQPAAITVITETVCDGLENATRISIRIDHELNAVLLDIPSSEICRQLQEFSDPELIAEGRSFTLAVEEAMKSIFNDARSPESPLAIARSIVVERDHILRPDDRSIRNLLKEHLNQANSQFSLVGQDEEYLPEGGESIEENWVFMVDIFGFGDVLNWVIVPRDPEKPVYNYGFN